MGHISFWCMILRTMICRNHFSWLKLRILNWFVLNKKVRKENDDFNELYKQPNFFFVIKIIHTMNQLKLKTFADANSKINGIEFVHPGDSKYLKD